MLRRYTLVLWMLTLLPLLATAQSSSEAVTFIADDGVTLHADLHRASDDLAAPLILLFHQGGGGVRGEYANILPRLLAEGYHVLATDLRRGGDRFGPANRTVAALPPDAEYGYCDAYPDVEAALAFANRTDLTGPRMGQQLQRCTRHQPRRRSAGGTRGRAGLLASSWWPTCRLLAQ